MNFPGKSKYTLIIIILTVFLPGCSGPDPLEIVDSAFISNDASEFNESPTPDISRTPTSTQTPTSTAIATLQPTIEQTPLPKPTVTPTSTPRPTTAPTDTPDVCDSPGQVVTGSHPSQIAGPDRAYRIYLPPCFGEDGRVYPTLYMLHGSASTESQWDDLGLDEAAETAIHTKQSPPFIIVMPAGGYLANNSSGGPYSFEGMVMSELMPHIEANYCAWAESTGRAIGGLSRGGYWALEIAFRHASEIGSVGAHSAALADTHAGPALNPQHTALTSELGNLRIYMDIGANDWFIPNIRKLHEDMDAAGIDHTWVLNEGIHEDAYWADHVAEYITWYSAGWPQERESYPLCNRVGPGIS